MDNNGVVGGSNSIPSSQNSDGNIQTSHDAMRPFDKMDLGPRRVSLRSVDGGGDLGVIRLNCDRSGGGFYSTESTALKRPGFGVQNTLSKYRRGVVLVQLADPPSDDLCPLSDGFKAEFDTIEQHLRMTESQFLTETAAGGVNSSNAGEGDAGGGLELVGPVALGGVSDRPVYYTYGPGTGSVNSDEGEIRSMSSTPASFSDQLPLPGEEDPISLFWLPLRVRGRRLSHFASSFAHGCVVCYLNFIDLGKTPRLWPKHELFTECINLAPCYNDWKSEWIEFKKELSSQLDNNVYCLSCGLHRDFLPPGHPTDIERETCPWLGFIYVVIWWIRRSPLNWESAVDFYSEMEGDDVVIYEDMTDDEFVNWLADFKRPGGLYNGCELVIWFLEMNEYWRDKQDMGFDSDGGY